MLGRIGINGRLATVLVVEYGDFDDTWNTAMPYYASFLQQQSIMFLSDSVPQPQLKNRTSSVPEGATVGGGSTVNGMAATRGEKPDYDAWQELGNPGWGWDALLPYFKKVEGIFVLLSPGFSSSNLQAVEQAQPSQQQHDAQLQRHV